MEKCELEVTEESKIKMEAEEGCEQNLGKHLGKLLVVLELAGIPVNEGRKNKFLDLLQKLCFPIFLHLICAYLLYANLKKGGFNYFTVIDTLAPIMPCVMWIMMRCQKASLESFLADLNIITSSNFKSHNRSLSYTTNAAICFIFIYPLLLLAMRVAQGSPINTFEVFRILRETIFPVTMMVVYASICYLLLQKLRYCKKVFHKKLDLTCSTAMDLMKDYLNVVKSVEKFENLLCNIVFVILIHDFLTVSILVIDMMYMSNWVGTVMFEAVCELSYVFFSFSMMAVFAGNVSFEMAAIKSVVLEKAFTQLDQGDLTNSEKRLDLLLKKDISILTVGKAFVFNRGAILKLLLVVFAEVVIICEVGPLFNR